MAAGIQKSGWRRSNDEQNPGTINMRDYGVKGIKVMTPRITVTETWAIFVSPLQK